MHARTSIPIALAGVALIFCAAADGRAPQTKLHKHLQPPSAAQDCVLLPKAEVVRQFPAAPPTLSVRTRESPYPSCTFLWTPLAQAERTIGGQRAHVFHVMVEDSDAPKAVRERAEAIARVLLRGER